MFKGPYANHILIPQGSTEVVHFLISNESPYFSICKSKISASILCSFGDMTKNVKLIGIPENNFLCIFIIASSPGVHIFFCLWRVTRSYLRVKLHKMHFRVKVNQLKVKNIHVKMGISIFNCYVTWYIGCVRKNYTIFKFLPRKK